MSCVLLLPRTVTDVVVSAAAVPMSVNLTLALSLPRLTVTCKSCTVALVTVLP